MSEYEHKIQESLARLQWLWENGKTLGSARAVEDQKAAELCQLHQRLNEMLQLVTRVMEGAQKGHAKAHGTDGEKRKRWAAYQAMVDAERERLPGWTRNAVLTRVAKRLGCSIKTLQRRTNW